MTTRDIRPSSEDASCDVCGRTLLRGERAHVYLDGGTRRSVCELCTARAVDEGWVREGSVPSFDAPNGATERRGSLLRRLRARGRPRTAAVAVEDEQPQDGEAPPGPGPGTSRRSAEDGAPRKRRSAHLREPRHVHAVPTGFAQRVAAAIDVFNGSEHRRTVAGVARSLGPPWVSVRPLEGSPALVHVVVAWELCWYRYEIDLSDEVPNVRQDAQGYELDELEEPERQPNAASDEHGILSLSGQD